MTFRKGQSGNPGGRPKGQAEIVAAALSHCPEAIETLFRAMKDERLCVQAAVALLDRGLGKPAQNMNLTGTLNIRETLATRLAEAVSRAERPEASDAPGQPSIH